MKEKITLKQVRLEHGLTQTEMAEKMGLCRSSIAKKEAGKIAITPKDLRVLRQKFKVNLENFDL